MATHSSVLAWRIPGTGSLMGLPSMGLHRVGHDWSDLAAAAAAPKTKQRICKAFKIHTKLFMCALPTLCQTTETSIPPTHQSCFHIIVGFCTNSSIFSKRLLPLAKSWPFFQTQVGCHFYRKSSLVTPSFFFFYCLFIYMVALGLSCDTQDPRFSLWHARSSSLTRDWTPDPCIGSIES